MDRVSGMTATTLWSTLPWTCKWRSRQGLFLSNICPYLHWGRHRHGEQGWTPQPGHGVCPVPPHRYLWCRVLDD